jgi:hypothetical protein
MPEWAVDISTRQRIRNQALSPKDAVKKKAPTPVIKKPRHAAGFKDNQPRDGKKPV